MFFNKKKTAIEAIAKSLENLSQTNPHYKELAELIEKTRCDLLIAAGLFDQKWDNMRTAIASCEREIELSNQIIENSKAMILAKNDQIKELDRIIKIKIKMLEELADREKQLETQE